jgi:hypothetical protein
MTDESKDFAQKEVLIGKRTASDWCIFFDAFTEEVLVHQKERAIRLKRDGYAILILMTTIIASIFLYSYLPFVIATVPFALFFYIFRRKQLSKYPDLKLGNSFFKHLENFIIPLFNILKEETKVDSLIDLYLDLRDKTTTKDFDKGEKKIGQTYVRSYLIPFLSIRFTLRDKSKVHLSIRDSLKSMISYKRSASGRLKTKLKYKVKTVYSTQVAFAETNYTGNHKIIQISSDKNYDYSIEKVLVAIAGAYQQPNPS